MANFYALLIGIDYYDPKPDNFDHLQGCVSDVDKMAGYLEKSLQVLPEQLKITRLTSPLSDKNSNADARSEQRKDRPPTYQNIVKAFNDITETAQAQDLVYIHYSGHGGRVKTIFPELKGEGQHDEGLVPMDVGSNGYYLRDVEMTTLLKRMTDKGLIVTVIFDSCHSGGATRSDGAVRGSRNGSADENDRPTDSAVADRATLAQNWLALTQGEAKESWLPNQRDYVFLGACRPTELANESTFDQAGRNGALTHWMIKTLDAVPSGLTYQALYDSVKGRIQSQFPTQLPMLLGEGERLVFGSEIKTVKYSLTVVQVETEQITLDGGIAQGVSEGSRFVLYPVGSDFTDWKERLAVVEIVEAQASQSIARILTKDEEGGIEAATDQIQNGLPAVMESEALSLKHPIRLFTKAVGNEDDQLPPELAKKQAAALEKVRQAMQGNGWVLESSDEEKAHYQVAIGRESTYEICAGMPITNLTPTLSIDDDDAPSKVVERLVHLGKYGNALALDNPSSPLKSSIEYELLDAQKKPFKNSNNIVLKSGTLAYLKVKNVSSQPLNVSILDFESTWEISQIPIQGDRNAFYSLQSGEESMTRLRFRVPSGKNYKQTEETLKLFATRGMANFQWLMLPSLDKDADLDFAKTRGSLHAGLRSATNPSPLAQLLSTIGADKDDPPPKTRAEYEPDPSEEWLTKSILLTIEQ